MLLKVFSPFLHCIIPPMVLSACVIRQQLALLYVTSSFLTREYVIVHGSTNSEDAFLWVLVMCVTIAMSIWSSAEKMSTVSRTSKVSCENEVLPFSVKFFQFGAESIAIVVSAPEIREQASSGKRTVINKERGPKDNQHDKSKALNHRCP